ncbi:hypothetical protein Q5H93_11985 [Hymenobacter sp. ASUV-10]|uniref:DUF4468 domain-containing protein n=1 Tax=Hymenobacter aranciens TaxID=3063996 RepID=A0ABT9BCR9_9BACT|nr:hypothetical protein [Hymenobacter sp. ASUV-10]MDO7875453.1 hypothetical protein [Hymenobacter sp. ASUV-10]
MTKLFTLLLTLSSLLFTHLATAQLYDVREGETSYNKAPRATLKVQVDGNATNVRDYFQKWMKDSYNVRFKSGGVMGMGKSAVLEAQKVQASTVSGKLVNLYATIIAPSDSVSEVAIFGGFDDKTFFDADRSANEFNALRGMLQNFAGAARVKAYRDMIEDAEKKLREAEKEKDRLEKERLTLAANTASNLLKIQEMLRQNTQNTLLSRSDSTQLVKNAAQRELDRARLQRRRDRLSALDRKN